VLQEGEKKPQNFKTPTTGAEEIKTITKTSSRCRNLKAE
jgi:hypothetical protein